MYSWLGKSFSEYIQHIQNISFLKTMKVPSWILFSLPDALWLYALTTLIIFIWQRKLSIHSLPWILFCPFIAFATEIGQGLKVIPGTFDIKDIIAYSIAIIISYCHLVNYNHLPNKLITIKKYEKNLL